MNCDEYIVAPDDVDDTNHADCDDHVCVPNDDIMCSTGDTEMKNNPGITRRHWVYDYVDEFKRVRMMAKTMVMVTHMIASDDDHADGTRQIDRQIDG